MKSNVSHRRPTTRHRPARASISSVPPAASLADYLARFCRGAAVGLAVVAVCASLLCAIGAAVLSQLADPDTPLLATALVLLMLLCTLYGGFVGVFTKERVLLGGLLGGLLPTLLSALGAALLPDTLPHLPSALVSALRGAMVLFVLFGVYLGVHLPAARKKGRGRGR